MNVSSPRLGNTEQPAALVATADGHIWRISLHRHQEPPQQPKAAAAADTTELSRVTIKIEDSDDEVEEEEEEEFELWNDEDGLLEDPEKLDSLSPASKRQRTSSPLPSRAPTSHPPAVVPESSSSITDATRSTVKVDLRKHLVGSEDDATKIICAFDGLLIFRRDKDPIYWRWQYQLVGSGSAVTRQDVSVDGARLETTCYVYERQVLPDMVVVGTKSGAVYKIEKRQETIATRLLCALKEPIASLILVPSREATGLPVLVAIGTMGTIGQVHLQAENSPPSPERSTIKTLKDVKVHGAFLVQAHAYLLTKEHRLFRVTLPSLLSDNASDMERVDLPSLLSCQPILSGSDTVGFYGINCDGQVLRMSADLARWGRPQVLSDARDDISKALGELEGLSWQAKQLEAECQLENHRIARYNQLVQQLKSCVLSEPDGQAGDDPPVLVSLTAFTQSVATGFNGSRRCFVRLNIRSAMNVDWSNGWSVVIRMYASGKACPHSPAANMQQHQEVITSLAGLAPQVAWAQDVNIDLHRFSLPLTLTVGLQLDETDTRSAGSRFAAYFAIESFVLDVIHFSEPVRDPTRQQFSAFLAQTMVQLRQPVKIATDAEVASDLSSKIYRLSDARDNACEECMKEGSARMEYLGVKPLVFKIDTSQIQVAQCLPALLGDGMAQDRAAAIVQSAYHASISVPEAHLPMSEARVSLQTERKQANLLQSDTSIVWLILSTKEGQGRQEKETVQVTVVVKGSDPRRTGAVHRALERRIEELFG
ncbi:hypothetical protein BGZ98_000590 [Dissophora globulifera]|nr:hypothetical protein BGZ98_000590 [Dissophora globulifera]